MEWVGVEECGGGGYGDGGGGEGFEKGGVREFMVVGIGELAFEGRRSRGLVAAVRA